MKDLSSASEKEQIIFLKSFDHILCDVDGVLWRSFEEIPGSKSAIKNLKNICKKITFVSNNTTMSIDIFRENLEAAGYKLENNCLITPIEAIIGYLKSIQFNKKIFLIGMAPLRDALSNAGFEIIHPKIDLYEDVPTYLRNCLNLDKEVGAVVCDSDVNINLLTLQMAQFYITNPNVLFISGVSDVKCFLSGEEMIGPGVFHYILQDITERSPINLAKPSIQYGEYIKNKLKIKSSEKVLVIGDSVIEDMGLAQNCGFQKLLVLSGITKRENVENWTYSKDLQPMYYVDSLKVVDDILNKLIKKDLIGENNSS